jgi:hypothetical protein
MLPLGLLTHPLAHGAIGHEKPVVELARVVAAQPQVALDGIVRERLAPLDGGPQRPVEGDEPARARGGLGRRREDRRAGRDRSVGLAQLA